MAPSAIPITTSDLSDNGVINTIRETAPSSLPKSNGFTNGVKKSVNGTASQLHELNASLCEFIPNTEPKSVPLPGSPEQLAQKTCTDHMMTCSWTSRTGWQTPQIKPYGPLMLMPTASCLHYATECFEGMKLYRGYDGKLRLFRPQLNAQRMVNSATRIALPAFDPEELLKLVVKLCEMDGAKWLPKEHAGSFLYIRPTMIANDPALGVQKPNEALLYVILACFPHMDSRPSGMKLLASKDDMVRAWPGGFGFAKVGANYGPTLICQAEARARGYDQILWLFGPNGTVTEAGASNFFIIWRTRSGVLQLITAPLQDRIILDGVTRRSVLQLTRERLTDLEVVERKFDITEVLEAYEEGRLVEAFAAGTAFFIAGVSEISWREKNITTPVFGKDGCGKYAGQIKSLLKGIMYGYNGLEGHEWGHVVEEKA